MTPEELLTQALAKLQTANRVDGTKNSWRRDNPTEYAKVVDYLGGSLRPTGVTSDMGMGLMLAEDARRALVVVEPEPEPVPPGFNPPSYKGMDYVGPEMGSMAVGCNNHHTWLKPTCWTVSLARLQKDIDYMGAQNLGKFQRLWVSLDQMFSGWNATTGFSGYDPACLANLHTALARFDAAGMQVALVAFATSNTNTFHLEALDGSHAAMRANYIEALRQFAVAIAGNPVSARTVAVIDIFNEAYYQSETRGVSNATMFQFLSDAYSAAKAAAPNLLYTVSDTTRLLTAQATWVPMYPVDVYDIHLYHSAPWTNVAVWDNGLTLPKPWFCGEAGCGPDNQNCTYDLTGDSTQTLAVDKWWLDNAKLYGAKAVCIEDQGTLFIRSDPTYQLRPVGSMVKAY